MTNGSSMVEDGVPLADAVKILRAELLEARREGASAEIQFPIESLTLELKVVATRNADGKAGFRVPIINAELSASGGLKREETQTVTVKFASPIDANGRPAPIARLSEKPKG
jgi:hypothetical protein